MMDFFVARRLVDQAECLVAELEDRLARSDPDYDGSDPYNDWWRDKLEDALVIACRRVARRRILLREVSL